MGRSVTAVEQSIHNILHLTDRPAVENFKSRVSVLLILACGTP